METGGAIEDRVAAARRLLDGGDLAGAARMAGEIRAERPAAGLRLLAGVALKRGDLAGARGHAEAAVAADPQDADALRALAFVEFSAGRRDAALELYRRAAEAGPENFDAQLDLARALALCDLTEEALARFEQAHARWPEARVKGPMAAALFRLDRTQEALALAHEALAQGLDSAELRCLLGQIRLETGEPARAAAEFRAALERQPQLRDALMGLAVAHARLHEAAAAREATRRYLELRPAVFAGAANEPEARVTVVHPLYRGHFVEPKYGEALPVAMNYPSYMESGRLRLRHVFAPLDGEAGLRVGETPEDVTLSNIVNGEALGEAEMARARAALEGLGAPVVNGLEGVARSARARLFPALEEAPEGLVVPKLLAFRADGDAARGARRLEAEVGWPCILRPARTQMGRGSGLVHDRREAEAALGRMGGQDLYAIAYHECRDAAGLSRMYRLAVIGERFVADRVHFTRSWTTHIGRILDAETWYGEGLDRIERAYHEAPESVIGLRPEELFEPVRRAVGLDVFGIDFGIDREGRAVLFEANASMNLMNPKLDAVRSYRPPWRAAFFEQVEALLLARAGVSAAS
ncbi:MAG: tetratricopeptide repeat protein [Pseudomonadota bacterium]